MGGVLDSVLERLADNLERDVSLRNRIRSAMTYPIVVLGFVGMILIAMLVFIVPQFKAIYADLHGTLPLLTRVLLTVSEIVRTKFWLVGLIIAVADLRPAALEAERARAPAVGQVQAEGPGVRAAVPEDARSRGSPGPWAC